jgi:hypothetical protein
MISTDHPSILALARTTRTATKLQINLIRYTSNEEEKACHKMQFISCSRRSGYKLQRAAGRNSPEA